MDLKKLVEAIDAQVLSGDIIGAFETFAGDQCITFSTTDDITHSKGQKSEALRWFFSNVASINSIERLAMAVVGENETHSQFKFDFTNNQGQPLVYSEVIRRVWKNGKLVEEQYLFGQTIKAAPAKKAKADAIAAPAAAPAKKAAAPKKAAPAEKPAPAAAKKVVATEKAAPAKVAPAKKEVVAVKVAPVKAAAPKKETVKTETAKKVAVPKAAKKEAPKAGKK